jgi:hypothetical protein
VTGDYPKNHHDLKALAKQQRRLLDTLHSLSEPADPWMAGVKRRSDAAQWVACIFERFEIRSAIHARQVHYRLVSQKTPFPKVDGTPYVNSNDCYKLLCDSIRDARYLDLISTDVIVDRRNPEPALNFEAYEDVGAKIEITHGAVWRLHEFGRDYQAPAYGLPRSRLITEPSFGQPFHLEIWIEKSTANDILLPLGEEYRVNICTFVGEVSATACKDLVVRAIESARPVRILYLSDFDPAGEGMPITAAVKIDFFSKKSGHDLDIRLEPVALTHEQCVQFQLPRTPIKETERRAGRFEERHGTPANCVEC